MAGGTVERTFKRSFDSLTDIFSFVDELLAGRSLDPSIEYDAKFALEELFTNIVKYGAKSDTAVTVGLDLHPDRLIIALTDPDSEFFDIRRTAEVRVDAPLAERRPGGLGIHLVKKLMDDIDYEYVGRRSRTILTKRLD